MTILLEDMSASHSDISTLDALDLWTQQSIHLFPARDGYTVVAV